MSSESLRRRRALTGLVKLMFFTGLVLVAYAFLSSFSSSDKEKNSPESAGWVITVDTKELVAGEIQKFHWAGRESWVYRRTDSDIALLEANTAELKDALSEQSDQPANMKTYFRSAKHQYFVFIPLENKKGCQVSLVKDDDRVRFTEPCYGAKYDAAGRIFKNSGHKEQTNLPVPEHIVEDGILKIAVWTPKR